METRLHFLPQRMEKPVEPAVMAALVETLAAIKRAGRLARDFAAQYEAESEHVSAHLDADDVRNLMVTVATISEHCTSLVLCAIPCNLELRVMQLADRDAEPDTAPDDDDQPRPLVVPARNPVEEADGQTMLTTSRAAKLLGISRQCVRALCVAGKIKHSKPSDRTIRLRLADVLSYLDQNTHGAIS